MYLYHMTTSANQSLFGYHGTEQPCARGQHQNNKRNSVLYANRLVYIAYEVRLSCKGPLRAALYVYCYLESQFYVFFKRQNSCLQGDVSIEYITAPVLLTESWFI